MEISYRLDSGFASVFSIADIFQQMGIKFLLKMFAGATNDGDRGMQAWI